MILASLKPYYYYLIAEEKKKIEVRKTALKNLPQDIAFYMSKDEKSFAKIPKEFQEKYRKHFGKIGMRVVCDKVYNLVNAFGGIMFADENLNQLEPQLFRDMSCLTDEQTADYLGDKDGYGWRISDLKIYDKPKELSEFHKPCEEKYYCEVCKHGSLIIPPDEEEYALYHGGFYEHYETVCHNVVNRPPQSWQFVEELKE